MPSPKRQHFIPRLHLQHFAGVDPKGHVWTYDSLTGSSRSAIPDETALESHFYSVERSDGAMDTSLEGHLASIEGKAAPTYQALLRGTIPKHSQARADFSTFLALMYVRTPAMRRMAGEMVSRDIQITNYAYATFDGAFESLARRVEKAGGPALDEAQKERIREGFLDPSGYRILVPKENTIHVLKVADDLAPLLFKMRWSLRAPQHGFFITSDNPLVRLVDPKTWHPTYGDHGFLNKTALVTFPLSPKMLLLMSWMDTPEFAEVSRQQVDRQNAARAAHSEQYIYAHIRHKRLSELAAKFKDTRPGMTTEGLGPDRFAESQVVRRTRRRQTGTP